MKRTQERPPTDNEAGRAYNAALDAYDKAERAVVLLAFEMAGWMEAPAARLLGLSKTAFRYLVDKHEMRERYDRARAAMGYTTGRVPSSAGGRKGKGA